MHRLKETERQLETQRESEITSTFAGQLHPVCICACVSFFSDVLSLLLTPL